MRSYSLRHLSDEDLTRELTAAFGHERQALATLLAHIAEFDARELYLRAGCSSMYRYCVDRLRLSEDAAARRIQVARLARDFPFILQALADGRLHLSGLGLLAPRITRENGHELLMATMGLSKGGVESLVAERFPIVPTAGALFSTSAASASFDASASLAPTVGSPIDKVAPCFPATFDSGGEPVPALARVLVPAPGPISVPVLAPLARVRPIAPGRFELVAVIDQETHDFLMQSRELLGHVVPTNALIDVLAQAIRAQHAHLRRRRCGATERPRTSASRPGPAHGDATVPRDDAFVRRSDSAPQAGRTGTRAPADPRRIPAAVRRAVWERDGGRCTFTSADGHRCAERSRVELDHVVPVARGGRSTAANLRLLCRAHNQHAAEREFGRQRIEGLREASRRRRAAERAHKQADRERTEARKAEIARQREELGEAFRLLGYRGADLERAHAPSPRRRAAAPRWPDPAPRVATPPPASRSPSGC